MSTKVKQNFPAYQDSDSTVVSPANEKEVSKLIKKFYDSDIPIELIGSSSKKAMGKPLQCAKTLNLSNLSGIIEYLPEELFIKVKACTPISLIEEELEKKHQQLAFEPIDFGYLYEGKSNYGTAAGHVSCNISGPRRFKTGSIRDHVLGFRGVNGKGEIIKSGGTVVKNVTGFDLSKLICGSYGTLIALTEITFKVLPSPEENHTLTVHNLSLERAIDLLEASVSSSHDVSGAVFLPSNLGNAECVMNVDETLKFNDLKYSAPFIAIRVEGSKNSVDEKKKNLINELKLEDENISILETTQSTIFWKKVKNLELFNSTKNYILRVVIPPANCTEFIYQLQNKNLKYYIDWGGALIWIESYGLSEEMFYSIRKKVVKLGGYVTMIKSSNDLNLIEDIFTITKDKFYISQNIKKSFDPKRILNPGKMYTGI